MYAQGAWSYYHGASVVKMQGPSQKKKIKTYFIYRGLLDMQ